MLPLSELGSKLKEARIEKGLTLNDLQEITKIQKRYLLGIEEGNYDSIPGKFYVRAFIKQYAEAVGIDTESLFDEFKQEIPSVYEEDIQEQITRTQSRKTDQAASKMIELLPKVLITAIVIGLIILGWFFVQKVIGNNASVTDDASKNEVVDFQESGNLPENKKSVATNKNNTAKQDTPKKETNSKTEDENSKGTQNISVISSEGNTTTYKLTNADSFMLNLKVTTGGKSWVGMESTNNKQLLNSTLTEDTPQSFDLTKEQEVKIRTGYAPALEVYINDEKIDIPKKANVQTIIIQYEKKGE